MGTAVEGSQNAYMCISEHPGSSVGRAAQKRHAEKRRAKRPCSDPGEDGSGLAPRTSSNRYGEEQSGVEKDQELDVDQSWWLGVCRG